MTEQEYAEAILKFMEHALRRCMDAGGKLKFDKKNPQHLVAVCLYGSIVEISQDIVDLTKLKRGTGAPVLLRSALEALARLRCCLTDAQHVKALAAGLHAEKLKPLKELRNNPANAFLAGVAEAFDVDQEIANLEAQLAGLAREGHRPLNAFEEFRKAGMDQEYRSMYWLLCLEAHSDLTALQGRHLRVEGEDYEVQWFKEPQARQVVRDIDSLCGLLLTATQELHTFLKTEAVSDIEALRTEFAALRFQHFKPNSAGKQ